MTGLMYLSPGMRLLDFSTLHFGLFCACPCLPGWSSVFQTRTRAALECSVTGRPAWAGRDCYGRHRRE
jgi:hypothetical protein